MPRLFLPSVLRERGGGLASPLDVDGQTVGAALGAACERHPALRGWVVDEAGRLRQHVKAFVGENEATLETAVAPDDEIHVVPAISGGSHLQEHSAMTETGRTELLIGTRKGLFVARGARGGDLAVDGRAFGGEEVEYAIRDPRSGTYLASVTHGQFGPHLYLAHDPLGEWERADGPVFPVDAAGTGEAAVERIWTIEPGVDDGELWCGVAPAALFRSTDGGRSWRLNRGLWNVPRRNEWEGGAGGLCLHSISPHPEDPLRLAVGISAAGVWTTDDGGTSWSWGVDGLVPRYIPEEARAENTSYCVHDIKRSPVEPEVIYMQFHGGVYRSDDAGATWNDIGTGTGLPSDFGFPLVIDPRDPARAFVIPLVADLDRVTPEGKVRVYETTDRGASWSPRGEGLPDRNAYLTVLRQAFDHDGLDPLGLYFGAESGEVFGSIDGGATWATLIEHLPPVYSVRCAR